MARQPTARRQTPVIPQVLDRIIRVAATLTTVHQLGKTRPVPERITTIPLTIQAIMGRAIQMAAVEPTTIIMELRILQLTSPTEAIRQILRIQALTITETTTTLTIIAAVIIPVITLLPIRLVEPTLIIQRMVHQVATVATTVVHLQESTITQLRILQANQ